MNLLPIAGVRDFMRSCACFVGPLWLGVACDTGSAGSTASHEHDAEPPESVADAGWAMDAASERDAADTWDAGEPIRDAGPLPVVDAGFDAATSPVGHAYAETRFELLEPVALGPLLTQAREALGPNRAFVNEFRPASPPRVVVEYGAADAVSTAEVRWQFSASERYIFWASMVDGMPGLVRSEPFTYRMLARVDLLLATSYVAMTMRDTVLEAQFDGDFLGVTAGTLRGALTRREAETSELGVGALCSTYCPDPWCSAHALSALSDLLDCRDAEMNLDRNGDGTPDAYRVELAFESARTLVSPHPNDAP